jgi:sensor histidine kinase YesM/DUF4097 and DUF4098 domain-containing protein YvlB
MERTPTIIKTIDAEGIKSLQLITFAGDIEILGTDENTIKIEIFASVRSWTSLFFVAERVNFIDDEINYLDINKTDETLRIFSKPNYFHPFNWFNFQKTSFRISLPKTIHSNLKTYGGNIYLKNIDGNHAFTTWGGNLYIENTQGILKGKTMGGKIEIVNSDAKIDANTWGGKVFLLENRGDIIVKTLGGNIEIRNQKGKVHASTSGGNILCEGLWGELQCSTWGGNIKLWNINGNVGASTKGGNVEAEIKLVKEYIWLDTAGGNIKTVLPLQQPMNLDISSSRIMLPNLPNFDGFRTQNQLMGKINGGGPSVKIKGTGGNIKIYDNNYGDFGETIKPQSSFEKRQEKIIEKKPPLPNASFFFLTLIFCILLTYGLSSIVYFTLQMINPQESQTGVDKILFFSNIANGLGSHLAVNIFILTLDNLIYDKLLKYLSIVTLTVILVVIFQSILYVIFIGYSQNLFKYSIENKDALIYTIIPLLVACICFYYWQRTHQISRKISEQEYQLLNLEKLKTTAELGALQARINPHFLYNSLNSIASLVHSDPDKAEEMTILLSKLFRYTTDRNDELFSSVADELEIVKTYLSIEQVRFGDRLKFTTKLESGLEKFQIPRLLLQPIVENAIKHGISKISGDGKIEVNIYEKSDNIILSVHDSGVLFPEEMASGYGLRSIQDKLRLIYGNDAALEIHNEPQYKSVVITIKKK